MSAKSSKIYDTSETWFEETVISLRSRLRVSYIIAGIALLVATVCAFAMAALAPLKTVVPYVIEVDKITGEAKVLKQYAGEVQQVEFKDVLSKYWINQYLIARESYNPKLDLEENYTKVQNLSEDKAFQMYAKRFADDHVDNPFKKYGDHRVEVEVKSISFLRSDTATVRYELLETMPNAEVRTKWIDIVSFKYTKTPSVEKQMLENPLGFKVTEYRSDREVIN